MIFVIAPLVKGSATTRYYLRLWAYSTALVGSSTLVFLAYGLIGRHMGLGHFPEVWLVLGIACLVYSAAEIGMVRLPVPSSNFVLPREWMRFPGGLGAVTYGSIMGLGFVTRAPYAAYHAVVAAAILAGVSSIGLGVGLAFGVGRLVVVYAAVAVIVSGLVHPVRLNDWTRAQAPLARLISGASLAMLAGSITATFAW